MFRCPECRTRRHDWGLFKQHLLQSGHRVCTCGGYHYKHRPGSPFCERNAWSAYREAERRGEDDGVLLDIAAHVGWERATVSPKGSPPPF